MSTLPQSISINLTVLSDNKLLSYAFTLLDGLAKSKVYPGVTPTLSVADPVIQHYAKALANAAKGGTAEKMLRDSLRLDVEKIIKDWSSYATETTPNDPQSWADAHFNLTKAERTPRPAPVAPTRFSLADGPAKGSIEVRQNAQAGVKAYVTEYALATTDPAAAHWQFCLCNTATCVISGLDSGQQYQIRSGAWNGVGGIIFSAIETRYVQ